MKYLENAIKFIAKHFIIAIPLFISTAITALIGGTVSGGFTNKLFEILPQMKGGVNYLSDPASITRFFASAAAVTGAGFLGFILTLIVTPATYGMVNKALNEDKSDLNEFVPQLKDNFVKYILYWVGNIVVWVILGIAAFLIVLLLALISKIAPWLGIFFGVLIALAAIVVVVLIAINLVLWFPAMVIDNMDVIAALKRSYTLVKKNFWMILGINLLVGIVASLASLILGILAGIPLLGPIILSVIPTASTFIIIVFHMMYYKCENNQPSAT
ncbi:MAG TPA: hypothetical protein PK733_02130 [Clostridiales bacterium]|nr:hypothetical protein [Clostridiales bacterium]